LTFSALDDFCSLSLLQCTLGLHLASYLFGTAFTLDIMS